MWWKVFKGEQPTTWTELMPLEAKLDYMKLLQGARVYQCGIHRIRINLVANWKDGQSVEDVRKQASESGEVLAHTEVMSAYGLHSTLFREQDGSIFPRADMGGICVNLSGVSEPEHVLCAHWLRSKQRAELGIDSVNEALQGAAVPTIL